MSKPILCLDFDGVLHSYTSKYTGPDEVNDPPTPGALEALKQYNEHFNINVFSSRSHQLGGRNAMLEWCRDHFDYDFTMQHLHFPHHKPPALVTLDDRALTFTGVWPSVAELRAFRPWNKPDKNSIPIQEGSERVQVYSKGRWVTTKVYY